MSNREQHVLQVTDATFNEQVLMADLPVMLEFWSVRCKPCARLAPILDELAGEYAGRAYVGTFCVDENPGVPNQYHVRGLPTIIFFKGGQEVNRIVGLRSKSTLAHCLENIL